MMEAALVGSQFAVVLVFPLVIMAFLPLDSSRCLSCFVWRGRQVAYVGALYWVASLQVVGALFGVQPVVLIPVVLVVSVGRFQM